MNRSIVCLAGTLLAALTLSGCASSVQREDPLVAVARVHGGHGPWAVAGYRMGLFAMQKLGLEPQSFDLVVEHHSPLEPQYACIADGASASTGASVGKLNLKLVEADVEHVQTSYRRKSSGLTITLRLTRSFVERFKDVPRPKLAEAGREVLRLADKDIFEQVP